MAREFFEAHGLAVTDIYDAVYLGVYHGAYGPHLVVEVEILTELIAGRHLEHRMVGQRLVYLSKEHERTGRACSVLRVHPQLRDAIVRGSPIGDVCPERGLAADIGDADNGDDPLHDGTEGVYARTERGCALDDVFGEEIIDSLMLFRGELGIEHPRGDDHDGIAPGIGF